jgi:hypothetical protein
VLKIDIEGSEYAVLNTLLQSGVLCRRVTDLFVEWHDVPENKQGQRRQPDPQTPQSEPPNGRLGAPVYVSDAADVLGVECVRSLSLSWSRLQNN